MQNNNNIQNGKNKDLPSLKKVGNEIKLDAMANKKDFRLPVLEAVENPPFPTKFIQVYKYNVGEKVNLNLKEPNPDIFIDIIENGKNVRFSYEEYTNTKKTFVKCNTIKLFEKLRSELDKINKQKALQNSQNIQLPKLEKIGDTFTNSKKKANNKGLER